jgi:SlyX protein
MQYYTVTYSKSTSGTQSMQNEIIELETKIAFQEDMIQALNSTLAEQQQELVELKRDIEELQTQLRNLAPSLTAAITEETPPHY